MKRKSIVGLLLISMIATLLVMVFPVAAAGSPPQIVVQTPTGMPDGRIIYKVKSGDTCISISLLNKIPLDELRRLNGLQGENCPLQVGQELLLGIVEATAGPAVTPTATPVLPAGTAVIGKGEVCINLFNDVNGNGLEEDGETAIAGGAVSLSDRSGKTSLTGLTTSSGDPLCFKDMSGGDYSVSLAVPDGYNATTSVKYNLSMRPGDLSTLNFGAQISAAAQPIPVSEGGHSPILGLLGGLLVLAGAGLGIYFRTLKR